MKAHYKKRGEFILKFFDCQQFVKPEYVVDKLPSNKEIYKNTLDIAMPSTVESVLIALISCVDMMMVGSIGADAIAAVGITNQPKFIILAVILALNVGVTVVVSHRKGEQDKKAANQCLAQALTISCIISLILSVLGFVFSKQIVVFAGATEQYATLASVYFKSIMVGNFFNSMSMTINAAQKGSGNTKIAMKTNLTANVVNLIFNYFLINGIAFFPKLGVLGAGIATSIGNVVAFFMSLASVSHSDHFLYLEAHYFGRFDQKTLKDLLNISSSSFAEQVFLRIGFFAYSKTIATLGMVAFATHNVCMNLLTISFAFGDGLSVATSSLVGQSLGAKRKDMALIYSKVTQHIGNIVGIVLGIVMIIFRSQLVALFTRDPEIIERGSELVFIITITVFFQITQVVTYGCLRSAGDVKFTAGLSLVSVTIIRPILTWLFCYPLAMGLFGAWISLFLDQFGRYFGSRWRYKKEKWLDISI